MLKKIFIIMVILALSTIFGDRIILQNQNIIEGMITSEDEDRVVIRTAAGELTINRNNIAELQKESLDVSYMHLANQHFERQQYEQAANYYEQAYRVNSINREARRRLEETHEILEEKEGQEHERLQAQINRRLQNIGNFQTNEEFEDLIQYLTTLSERRDTPESIRENIKQTLPDVYIDFADFLLDRMNKMYAIDQLEKALELDPDRMQAKKLLADLYATETLTRRKALEMYKELYDQTDDAQYLQNIVTISQRANLLLDNFKYVKAYYEENPDDRQAQRAYKNSLQLSLEDFQRRNNYNGMKRIYEEMEKLGEEVDPMEYKRIDFRLKARQASLDDVSSIIEASHFARENDLTREGFNFIRRYYQQNRSNETLQEEYYQYAEVMFEQAQNAINRRDYEETIRLADNIREYFPDFERKDDIASLLHKAELEKEREKEAIRDRAMLLAQRGDDYYRRGQSYIQQMRRTDFEITHFDNPYREALKWMERARDMYQQSIQLDPELAYPEYADLRTKLADVNHKLMELHNMRRHRTFYRIESHDYTEPYYDYDDYDELDYY